MALSERTRHEVYEHARRTWSDEAAEALMEMLPPVGWADVATKRDIDLVRMQIDGLRAEFEGLRAQFEGFRTDADDRFATKADLHREINRLILWFVPFNLALAFGVGRLAG